MIEGFGLLGLQALATESYYLVKGKPSLFEDLTETYKKAPPMVYGRDKEIQSLAQHILQGSAILLGPSGVGKSTLVYELARRISLGQFPKLKNFKILRFKWAQSTQTGGLKKTIFTVWQGGVGSQVTNTISKAVEYREKNTIFFVDEIQDILSQDQSVFDQFKESLSTNEIRIIGATTARNFLEQWRKRTGAGQGMERRMPFLPIDPMTTEDTAYVILEKFEHLPNSAKLYKRSDLLGLHVVLASEIVFPEKVQPNAAIDFFNLLVSAVENRDLPSIQANQEKNTPISFGASLIFEYVDRFYAQQAPDVVKQLRESMHINTLLSDLSKTTLTSMERDTDVPDFIKKELKSFEEYKGLFKGASSQQYLGLMQGNSNHWLWWILKNTLRDNEVCYRFDFKIFYSFFTVSYLRESLEMLLDILNQKHPNKTVILSIALPPRTNVVARTNDQPTRAARTHTQPTRPDQKVSQKFLPESLPSNKEEILEWYNSVSSQFSLSQDVSSPSAEKQEKPIISQEYRILTDVSQEMNIPLVMTLPENSAISAHSIFQSYCTWSSGIQFCQHLFPKIDLRDLTRLILAVYHLPLNVFVSQGLYDHVISILSKWKDGSCSYAQAMCEAFPSLGLDKAEEAWSKSQSPFRWVEDQESPCLTDAPLTTMLWTFKNAGNGALLRIEEESKVRQEQIIRQLAQQYSVIDLTDPYWVSFSCDPKRSFLNLVLSHRLKNPKLILVNEDGGKDPMLLKTICQISAQFVCFQPPTASRSVASPTKSAWEQGWEWLQNRFPLVPQMPPLNTPLPDPRSLAKATHPYKEFRYVPLPLDRTQVTTILAQSNKHINQYLPPVLILYDKGASLDVLQEALKYSTPQSPKAFCNNLYNQFRHLLPMSSRDFFWEAYPAEAPFMYPIQQTFKRIGHFLVGHAPLPSAFIFKFFLSWVGYIVVNKLWTKSQNLWGRKR